MRERGGEGEREEGGEEKERRGKKNEAQVYGSLSNSKD